jgi:hypothetical protein
MLLGGADADRLRRGVAVRNRYAGLASIASMRT